MIVLVMMFKYDFVKVIYININFKNSSEVWLYIGKVNIYLNWLCWQLRKYFKFFGMFLCIYMFYLLFIFFKYVRILYKICISYRSNGVYDLKCGVDVRIDFSCVM